MQGADHGRGQGEQHIECLGTPMGHLRGSASGLWVGVLMESMKPLVGSVALY